MIFICQINIRHNKKNSYNAAICKSQENLVKVTPINLNLLISLLLQKPHFVRPEFYYALSLSLFGARAKNMCVMFQFYDHFATP